MGYGMSKSMSGINLDIELWLTPSKARVRRRLQGRLNFDDDEYP